MLLVKDKIEGVVGWTLRSGLKPGFVDSVRGWRGGLVRSWRLLRLFRQNFTSDWVGIRRREDYNSVFWPSFPWRLYRRPTLMNSGVA